MQPVRVDKTKLLIVLRQNRDDHRQLFEDAIDGYRTFVIKNLEEQIDRLRSGKKIAEFLQFEVPEDHTKDYDRLIGMFEMTEDLIIELTQAEYAQYVDDDWQWQRNFVTNASSYTGTAASSPKFRKYLDE